MLLLENGADVAAKTNTNGATPLHIAICRDNEALAELLFENGADYSAKTKDGDTPLHLACNLGLPLVSLLLEKGADASAKANDGDTPLHSGTCSCERHQAVMRLLLHAGADVSARANCYKTAENHMIQGATPLHLAFPSTLNPKPTKLCPTP
ncbi:ankyrin repeat-containing domain protein [Baffinella frigidus]|nr:ankyrin repeat-containing domain protein [Cryptophyta sp. CCMP2293]